jgi:excinuclease ABC subunit C
MKPVMNETLRKKLSTLPKNPGVYLFKNSAGEILYVGKAKKLNNRVRSYFNSRHNLAPRTQNLVAQIADVDYILCDTETESLMLENNLIKKHQPRYNVLLRDDKNYQFIKIDYSTEIPQITTARKIEGKNIAIANKLKSYKLQANKYFGPYTSGFAVRQTLRLLRYVIPYCSNKKVGTRPCFYYHLGRCPGVCFGKISLEEYRQTIQKIQRFLSGELASIKKEMEKEMRLMSQKKLFEKAGRLRDQAMALGRMLEKQKIISPRRENFDVLACSRAGNVAAVTLFGVRDGKLIASENFLLENAKDAPAAEILQSFAEKYYLETSELPKEIFAAQTLADEAAIRAIFSGLGRKIVLSTPRRGRKKQLLSMAEKNAQDFLEKTAQNLQKEQAVTTRALFELKDKLSLPEIPLRIECYDISNIQGKEPVGSMVVFENGKAKKSDYKRFAVRSLSTPNDVGMMEEVLSRRFAHTGETESEIRNPKFETNSDASWRLPDLVVVDGGKAQLNVVLEILKEKKLKIPALGLAKKLEEIYLPQSKFPLRLQENSPALHLLQRIRDEAHRFAITYHRKRRSKSLLK